MALSFLVLHESLDVFGVLLKSIADVKEKGKKFATAASNYF